MKVIKKLTGILLMTAMLVSLLGVTSFAATSDYTIKDGMLTAYTGTEKDLVLPDNLGIKRIDMYAFTNNETVTSVTIPANIEAIDSKAFMGCSYLTSISVASGNAYYTSVSGVLFSKDMTRLVTYPYGKAGDYTIPSGVTEILASAFSCCMGLTSVTIPEGVETIREYAFTGCDALHEVMLPASVKLLDSEAFGQCIALTKLEVAKGNANYASMDGVLFNKNLTKLILFPGGNAGSYKVPSSVKTIAYCAFNNCTSLFGVTIPLGVTTIEHDAFLNCTALMKVIVSSTVTGIGDNAFGNCPNVTLYGAAGSYAETYTKAHNLGFSLLTVVATPTAATVLVNGKTVAFDAFNIGGNNYFKLRDLAMALNGSDRQFELGWDATKLAISLTMSKPYSPVGGELTPASGKATATAQISTDAVYMNGTEISLKAYKINGNNYFKLRDVAEAIDFSAAWNGEKSTIEIDTTSGYVFE